MTALEVAKETHILIYRLSKLPVLGEVSLFSYFQIFKFPQFSH
jgi:hypothetical protein